MNTTAEKATKLGRKKREIPARVVKLDADLVSMAELLARREGKTTGRFIADVLRPSIERMYAKLVAESARFPKKAPEE